MLRLLMGALGGVWGYVAAALIAAAVAGWAGHSLTHKVDLGTINGLRAQMAQQQAVNATAALAQFEADAARMHQWASAYQSDSAALDGKLDTIRSEFAHAIKAAPLPADCKPDAQRLRALTAAVAATNAAIAAGTGRGPGAGLPPGP